MCDRLSCLGIWMRCVQMSLFLGGVCCIAFNMFKVPARYLGEESTCTVRTLCTPLRSPLKATYDVTSPT